MIFSAVHPGKGEREMDEAKKEDAGVCKDNLSPRVAEMLKAWTDKCLKRSLTNTLVVSGLLWQTLGP